MTDYTELVKALRNRRVCVQSGGDLEKDFPLMRRAAGAIEELSKRLDESIPKGDAEIIISEMAKPRWIPVTERLPEKDGDYLVWYLIEDGAEPWFAIFPFDSNVPSFGYWDEDYDPVTYRWAGSDFVEIKGVSHWMPLPEPPKEEAEVVIAKNATTTSKEETE